MYERLVVARDFLKEDGVIVIHIDENEYPNLEKLLAEVFGEDNNLGTVVWDKRNPKGDATGIAQQHELISFTAIIVKFLNLMLNLKDKKKTQKLLFKKLVNLFRQKVLVRQSVRSRFSEWLKNQNFTGGEKGYSLIDDDGRIFQSVSMGWPNKKKAPDDYFIPLIHPVTKKKCPVPERGWRNPSVTMKKLQDEGLILFGVDHTTQPRRKYFLDENMFENVSSLLYFGGSDDALLSELGVWFDTPKVVAVSKKLILPICKDNDIILDYFSGSSTSAHAVMELNAEDNCNRKFIMVQLPEKTDEESDAYKAGYKTITEIGKERIRVAGKKIVKENGDTLKERATPLDIGFRVYKTDDTNMKDVFYHPAKLDQKQLSFVENNIKEDRTPEDLLTQVILELGLELSLPIEIKNILGNTVYVIQTNALVACFDKDIDFKIIDAISDLKPFKVVFKDASFKDDKTT